MPAKILYRDAQGREGTVDLRSEPVWVGRAMECAIRTDDAMVSRKHSMIRMDGGRFWVEDLGSSNGTHVNDVKVQRQALAHNDVVRCGSLWLRYIEDGPLGVSAASSGPSQPTSMVGPSGAGLPYQSTMATPGRPDTIPGRDSRPQQSVVVDMGGGSNAMADRYRAQADDLRGQLEMIRAERDKEVAENKRLRAENANLAQRIDDGRTQAKESEEVIDAHKRVAEEIRSEMEVLRDRDGRIGNEITEAREDLASRTRQLQRANEDIAKLKSEMDSNKKQVLELSKMKDEGFRKLNEQLAEVEHLREVIREQERMLEERRVGLIGLEEAIQDLRKDREVRIKETGQLKGERDELRIGFNRLQAQHQSTDEENRRLARLMQDFSNSDEIIRVSRQLKDAQFEAESQEAEKNRVTESLKVAEAKIEKLMADVNKLETASSSDDSKAKAAMTEMRKAEEGRIKAEQLRNKSEQEKAEAQKARDDAGEEVARLKERVQALESAPPPAAPAADPAHAKKLSDLEEKFLGAERRTEDAQKRLADIMERASKLEDENEELRSKAKAAPAPKAAVAAPAGGEIRGKALEVYHSVNDVLAELRVNISVVRDEFDAFAGKNSEPRARTIRDAIEAAAGQTEDVKGVLRNLRELAET